MHTLNKSSYALAIGMAALAGCVDAIGFLHLGGYFISFMSGNSTRLAVNVAAGDPSAILLVAGIIALFIVGTILGVLVRHFSKAPLAAASTLAFITLLLSGAALSCEMRWAPTAIACMILAMGAENAVLQRSGEEVVGVTYMTGTLVKVGQRLAYALLGDSKFSWVPYALLWLGLIAGGITGTLLFQLLGLRALWLAVLWSASLSAIAFVSQHRLAD